MWYDSEAYKGDCGEMEFDPGFKQDSMIEQLNKVIDSAKIIPGVDVPEKKFKPMNTLVTEEGDEFVLSPDEAEKIYNMVISLKPTDRLEVLKHLQTTVGLS